MQPPRKKKSNPLFHSKPLYGKDTITKKSPERVQSARRSNLTLGSTEQITRKSGQQIQPSPCIPPRTAPPPPPPVTSLLVLASGGRSETVSKQPTAQLHLSPRRAKNPTQPPGITHCPQQLKNVHHPVLCLVKYSAPTAKRCVLSSS